MTKSLTEQWKDGELEEGYYYLIVKDMDGIIIDSFDTWYHVKGNPVKQFTYVDIQEVLAPVPTFDEYKKLKEKLSIALETLGQIAKLSDNTVDAVQCAKAISDIEGMK